MPIVVRKIPFEFVTDMDGLLAEIESGSFTADEILGVIGKTEGNGGVNDFSRVLADRVFRDFLNTHGTRSALGDRTDADRVVRRHRRCDRAPHERVCPGGRRR